MKQSTLFISLDISQQNFLEKGSDALIYILVQALSHGLSSAAADHIRESGIPKSQRMWFFILLCATKLLSRNDCPNSLIHSIWNFSFYPHSYTLFFDNLFITSLLRYNLYTIHFTHLNYTSEWFLLFVQSYATMTTIHFRTFSSPSPKTPIPFSYHPIPT